MFADQLGSTMEVYVDDMLVKSLKDEDHIQHLQKTFQTLRSYRMRLNPLKCAFEVVSEKFLGFVSKATDKCLPFFKILKGGKRFKWTTECETAFHALKEHLGHAPLLSKPKVGEPMLLYLAVSEESVSSVLIQEEEHQLPVYYPRAAIKGQALADFMAKFTNLPEVDISMTPTDPPTCVLSWHLPGHRNEDTKDSQLVVSQVNGNVVAREKGMVAYLKMVRNLILYFEKFELIQVPRADNSNVDALSKLASSKDSELLKMVPIEHLV
ncbi:Ribonuclease H [Abeliophyllum distichum]|uniref:Ribonuclease H n=1 Tax=Abeliophyllum distichum TaxID=126358 RepID=A0ABD1UR25_9LAMI